MTPHLAWIELTGMAVLGIGAALLLWALLADSVRHRAGARRRCQRCWYDMTSTPGLTCPECGRAARRGEHLLRPRRRWRWAAFAVLLVLIGLPSALATRTLHSVWPRRVPDMLLVSLLSPSTSPTHYGSELIFLPALSATQDEIVRELARRAIEGHLSPRARKALAAHQFRLAPPLALQMRPQWPTGVPLHVRIQGHFTGNVPRELIAVAKFPGAQPIRAANTGVQLTIGREQLLYHGADDDGGVQCVGVPPRVAGAIGFDVTVTESGVPVWNGMITQRITLVPSINSIVTPVRSAEIDGAIRSAAAGSLRVVPDAALVGLITPAIPGLADVCVGIRLEFVHGGAARAHACVQWRHTSKQIQVNLSHRADRRAGKRPREWEVPDEARCGSLEGDIEAVRGALANPAGWTVRIVPDAELVLSDFDAVSYWDGAIEVPLADALGKAGPE